jgi:predicted TIM-barrel fold metal-dependent hydrolase
MGRPRDVGAIDTLIGFRSQRNVPAIAGVKGEHAKERHVHGYMFKQVPVDMDENEGREGVVAETLGKMDEFNIQYGLLSYLDPLSVEAARAHPDRFGVTLGVDGNQGMDAVRTIMRLHEEIGLRAVTVFPAGTYPQVPINHRLMYPIYAKCCELDLPVLVNVGVPGPRVPMMCQYTGHLDEVCYDFPDLTLVMRHGAEPWEELAVKLMLKWPNLYYSTTAFAPKHYPKAIVDYANSRGSDKIIYGGYYPFGLELDRIFRELDDVPFKPEVWPKFLRENAKRALKLDHLG